MLWEIGTADEARPALEPYIGKAYEEGDQFCVIETTNGRLVSVPANLGGKIVDLTVRQGQTVKRGDIIGYIKRTK